MAANIFSFALTSSVESQAQLAYAIELGAKKIAFVKRWWVMEAPTGQRFCVVRTKFPERGLAWNDWD